MIRWARYLAATFATSPSCGQDISRSSASKLRTVTSVVFAILFSVLIVRTAFAQVGTVASPMVIAFQGVVTDAAGNPMNGAVNIVFRLYDAPTGGAPLWAEEWAGENAVNVENGLFNIALGSLNPTLATSVSTHDRLYLGVSVGSDSEMMPRVLLGSTPYAMRNPPVSSLSAPDGEPSMALKVDDLGRIGIGTTAIQGHKVDIDSGSHLESSTGAALHLNTNTNVEGLSITTQEGHYAAIFVRNASSDLFAVIPGGGVRGRQLLVDAGPQPFPYLPVSGTGVSAAFLNGNVGIGTLFPQSALAVNGTITAKEIVVTETGWADYVFADDYSIMSLADTAQYINQHGHLPGIPSAEEVKKDGVAVGDMQVLLLQKIEELTLHQIELEQENAMLKERLTVLEGKQ